MSNRVSVLQRTETFCTIFLIAAFALFASGCCRSPTEKYRSEPEQGIGLYAKNVSKKPVYVQLIQFWYIPGRKPKTVVNRLHLYPGVQRKMPLFLNNQGFYQLAVFTLNGEKISDTAISQTVYPSGYSARGNALYAVIDKTSKFNSVPDKEQIKRIAAEELVDEAARQKRIEQNDDETRTFGNGFSCFASLCYWAVFWYRRRARM